MTMLSTLGEGSSDYQAFVERAIAEGKDDRIKCGWCAGRADCRLAEFHVPGLLPVMHRPLRCDFRATLSLRKALGLAK